MLRGMYLRRLSLIALMSVFVLACSTPGVEGSRGVEVGSTSAPRSERNSRGQTRPDDLDTRLIGTGGIIGSRSGGEGGLCSHGGQAARPRPPGGDLRAARYRWCWYATAGPFDQDRQDRAPGCPGPLKAARLGQDQRLVWPTGQLRHMRNTPKRVSSMGALSDALMARARTWRVCAGSMTPSSHSRAVEW